MNFFRLLAVLFTVSGCSNAYWGHTPTRIDPFHVRSGLQDSSAIIAVPIVIEKKKTGGVRSLLEIRIDLFLTSLKNYDAIIIPNGFVIGPRLRL